MLSSKAMPDQLTYEGPCAGGPKDGERLCASVMRIRIPIRMGPDRGEGDRGFGYIEYLWNDAAQMWIWQG